MKWTLMLHTNVEEKPDFIAVVMRRDKVLTSYKSSFINILFGEGVD